MPFTFTKTEIPEVIEVVPSIFKDERGFFLETYQYEEFAKHGITKSFVQDNHSRSVKGVLRGLHFQKSPLQQGKLVRCTFGAILDVAVDIREYSPTFKKYIMVELSADNRKMLWIPEGFAHGFLTLSDEAELQYKCTNLYHKELDAGIFWQDPELNIPWPIKYPILSEKDKHLPTFFNYA